MLTVPYIYYHQHQCRIYTTTRSPQCRIYTTDQEVDGGVGPQEHGRLCNKFVSSLIKFGSDGSEDAGNGRDYMLAIMLLVASLQTT